MSLITSFISSAFTATLKRDLLIAFRNRSDFANPLFFFVIVITLYPLGVSPEKAILTSMAPGVIWVAALLAVMLSIDGLFRQDFEDGSLEQLLLTPQPLFIVVLAKVLSHWLVAGFPLVLASPLLGYMLYLDSDALPVLMLSLLLGTPVLSIVGAIGSALTVGLRRGGVLIALLVLPLYIPVLIFGTAAVKAATMGLPVVGHLAILGAFLSLAVTLAPFAIAAALRISVSG